MTHVIPLVTEVTESWSVTVSSSLIHADFILIVVTKQAISLTVSYLVPHHIR